MTEKITKVRIPAITLGLTDEQIHWWAVEHGHYTDQAMTMTPAVRKAVIQDVREYATGCITQDRNVIEDYWTYPA